VLIGFVAGIIARLVSSAPNKPTNSILTTALGIIGAFLRHLYWAGCRLVCARSRCRFIAATIGGIVVFIWNRVAASRARLASLR